MADRQTSHEDAEARQAADRMLVDSLRLEGFRGPLYEKFVSELVSYALPIMRAWLKSGVIFAKSIGHGRLVERPSWLDAEDVDDLAMETVAYAIEHFRKALERGAWDPNGQASLRTYFVGGCVFAFPNVFRRHERLWNRTRRRMVLSEPAAIQEAAETVHPGISFEDSVVDRGFVESVLKRLDETTARIMVLSAVDGLAHAHIAEIVGVSVRAVEGRLRRGRAALRERLVDEMGGGTK